MSKVFVSHASEDRVLVEAEIIRPLRELGLQPWYSRDDIATQEEWEQSIARALESCEWFVVALTPRAVDSAWVRTEVRRALDKDAERVVPLLMEPCQLDKISIRLPDIQGINFVDDIAVGRRRFHSFWLSVSSPRAAPGPASGPTFGLDTDLPAAGGGDGDALVDTDAGDWEVRLDEAIRDSAPASIAFVLASLGHGSKAVVAKAQVHLDRVGVDGLCRHLVALATSEDEASIRHALHGLHCLRASRSAVEILTAFGDRLSGVNARRCLSILERKVAGLDARRMRQRIERVEDRFKLREALGQGPLTISFLAEDRDSGLPIVVRVLKKEFAEKPAVRSSFVDAMQRSQRLVHPNLVITRWSRRDEKTGLYFTVRDYVDGITLRDALEDGRRPTPQRSVDILRQILLALLQSQLHDTAAYHGGLHPGNVFVDATNKVTVGDPAPAVAVEDVPFTGMFYGYRYVAPEVLLQRGESRQGRRSDLYSVGCMAYELLAGRPLRTATGLLELIGEVRGDPHTPTWAGADEVPAALRSFVAQLVEPRSERRTDSIRGALAALMDASKEIREREAMPDVDDRVSQFVSLTLMQQQDIDRTQAVVFTMKPEAAPGEAPETPAEPERITEVEAKDAVDDAADGPPDTRHGDAFAQATAETRLDPSHLEGVELDGRFLVLRRIGVGGMAVTYAARDRMLDEEVVVKVPRSPVAFDTSFRNRFEEEIRSLVRLRHPNIVSILGRGEVDEVAYYAMQAMSGGSLADRMRGRGQFSLSEVLSWLAPIASALDYVHGAGRLHGDVKPSNILFDESAHAVLSDFGIATAFEHRAVSAEKEATVFGTPAYMAPEVQTGGALTGSADLYSLATIVYECLTGRRPLNSPIAWAPREEDQGERPPPVSELADGVSKATSGVMERALAFDPGHRFATCTEFYEALRASTSAGKPWWRRLQTWLSRR